MPGPEEGKGGIDLAGYFAQVKLRELEQKAINDKIEGMDKKIRTMGENIEKVVLATDGMGEGKRTILDFNIQQCWDRIKVAEHGFEDMDKIFSERFAGNPKFRKQALGQLSDEQVVKMVQNKELDKILSGVCKDATCRADLTARVKEAQKGSQKKLL